MQNTVNEGVQNLHVEIIRQFEIQQVICLLFCFNSKNEFDSKLEKYFTQFNSFFKHYEEMKTENQRLKKTSF